MIDWWHFTLDLVIINNIESKEAAFYVILSRTHWMVVVEEVSSGLAIWNVVYLNALANEVVWHIVEGLSIRKLVK